MINSHGTGIHDDAGATINVDGSTRIVVRRPTRGEMFGVSGGTLAPFWVLQHVLWAVQRLEEVDPSKVTEQSHLMNDLGLDIASRADLVMALQKEFEVEIDVAAWVDTVDEEIATVEDAVYALSSFSRGASKSQIADWNSDVSEEESEE